MPPAPLGPGGVRFSRSARPLNVGGRMLGRHLAPHPAAVPRFGRSLYDSIWLSIGVKCDCNPTRDYPSAERLQLDRDLQKQFVELPNNPLGSSER
jgi:hypothetical protein